MRENLPVTDNEFLVPEGMIIISETDLKGIITKVNEEFCHCSGFTEDELVGQPHNILRHPAVPDLVFKDMWETIQEGRGWSQIVKNRRKEGDYYWLRANVGPIKDDSGNITGYISHRMGCDGIEKDMTVQFYEDIAEGFLAMKNGEVFIPED